MALNSVCIAPGACHLLYLEIWSDPRAQKQCRFTRRFHWRRPGGLELKLLSGHKPLSAAAPLLSSQGQQCCDTQLSGWARWVNILSRVQHHARCLAHRKDAINAAITTIWFHPIHNQHAQMGRERCRSLIPFEKLAANFRRVVWSQWNPWHLPPSARWLLALSASLAGSSPLQPCSFHSNVEGSSRACRGPLLPSHPLFASKSQSLLQP